MGAYVANPQDPTQPTTNQLAGNMAYELQALKGYIQSLISSGTNFYYAGGFRNRLRNGGFNIQQRGTSGTVSAATPVYTLDGWQILPIGGAVNWSTSSPGSMGATSNYLEMVPQTGCTAFTLYQRIESYNCQDMVVGTPITVSGFLYVNSLSVGVPSITLVTATSQDNFGTVVGAVAAPITPTINPQQVNTFQFFSATFILTADCSKGLQVNILFASPVIGDIATFASLQLEKGYYYTQFEQRPIAIENEINQRYYETGYIDARLYCNTLALSMSVFVPFSVSKRATPNIVYSNITYTNSNTAASDSMTYNGFRVTYNSGTGNVMTELSLNWTASAEL